MTAQRRFTIWRVVVAATLVGDTIVATVAHRPTALAATALASTALLVMLALLWTTPPDAIVLPRRRSETIIGGASLALYAIAAITSLATTLSLPIVAIACTAMGLLGTRRLGVSAWWIAPVAWNPVALAMVRATG